ncbi:Patellin-4 [Acorus calamus]|uniref:Patellin-4 n=1 Tax=Acorus calamus TaxID=4465 RepID=A0AAV9E4U4_ACOCL|nr:Patellin-4 [Acorus calamus]
MTVETKSDDTHIADEPPKAVVEPVEAVDAVVAEKEEDNEEPSSSKPVPAVEKSSSFKEESLLPSDLNEAEKKALSELRLKLEETAEVEKEVSLWGVPLLPSKASPGTDVILLKFLRAREFKVEAALEMLKNTLRWRKESRIDSILDEEGLGDDLEAAGAAYMSGTDREGHPICYNVYGVFGDAEAYQKTFGTEEKRERFLRWRFQLLERGIRKLNFEPGGVASILQITDLKDAPGPSKKELRVTTKRAVGLLQDNYPEFVARNIFINVPFWYYAFHSILSPFLTQRTKSKLVFARPASVTETLLKYIPAEEIPIRYGGLQHDNDTEFSLDNGKVLELVVKAGSTETIELPMPEVGTTLLWDLTVLGWDVNYKEEFIPTDEGFYTIIVQKGKKMGTQDAPIRNSFRNNEQGKVVLTIENSTFKKKKVLYRYKTKGSA